MAPDRRAGHARGLVAESIAGWLLRLKGYRVLATRYRTPLGEIDIVARRGKVLAFVEVKARPSLEAGLEAIAAEGSDNASSRFFAAAFRRSAPTKPLLAFNW